MRKRLISTILVWAMMFLSANGVVFAENISEFKDEVAYAKLFLQVQGYGENSISNPVKLYNFDEEVEAVCFTVNNSGYIIINVNDLEVPEYALEVANPFSDEKERIIYNGPLAYYIKENGKIKNLKTKATVNGKAIAFKYKREKIDKKKKITETETLTISLQSTFYETGSLNNTLRTFASSHFCGVDGSAI